MRPISREHFLIEFSGDLNGIMRITNKRTGETFEVPFAAVVHAVAEWTRTLKIQELERASDAQILGLPPKENQ